MKFQQGDIWTLTWDGEQHHYLFLEIEKNNWRVIDLIDNRPSYIGLTRHTPDPNYWKKVA